MSNEGNKAINRRWLEVRNTGDLGPLEEIIAPDLVIHRSGATTRSESAVQDHAQMVAAYRASLADLHYTIEDLLADGDQVVLRLSGSFTHQGELKTPWATFPPTGKRLTFTEICIHRCVGSKIAEMWWETDWAGLLEQLGALPAATSE